jgi:ribosomal protein S18 acetylase RimI-like enzyme
VHIELDGYRPGALAGIIALHAAYYAREWKFGLPFEAKVASELSEFLTRMDPGSDLFLAAYSSGEMVGSVVVDHSGGGPMGAHLRWFIVSDATRGTGLGRRLIETAIAHCDARGFDRAWLTTFAGLDAARALYERHGFVLISEADRDQWSGGVREQLFERRLPAKAGA